MVKREDFFKIYDTILYVVKKTMCNKAKGLEISNERQ